MTHTRNRFQFRICGVFRLTICFAIVVAPLVFFSSRVESGPGYDQFKNIIDEAIYRDSSKWSIDKYTRGDLTLTGADVISEREGIFKVYGNFRHKTVFGKKSSKDFTCTLNRVFDNFHVRSCCWYEPVHGSEWCTQ